MENHYRVNHSKNKTLATDKLAKLFSPRRNSFRQEQMALAATNRADNWAKDKLEDETTLNALKTGMVTLYHPSHHKFRSESIKNTATGNIYVRKYMNASQRAEEAMLDFTSSHLGSAPYIPKKTIVDNTKSVEKHMGPNMRFGIRTENERLNNHLEGVNRLVDPAAVDTKMIYNPSWKENVKEKWTTKKDFNLTTCLYNGRKAHDPWPMVQGGINIGDNYIDGFEVVGDVSKKRKKNLEISTKDFISTVTPSSTRNQFFSPLDSKSIRTSRSQKFFAATTTHQKSYPKTLLNMAANNNEDFMEEEKPVMTSAPKTRVISIRTGAPLDPLRESNVSPWTVSNRMNSTSPERFGIKPFFAGSRKAKQSIQLNKEDMIKQTVKSYFE